MSLYEVFADLTEAERGLMSVVIEHHNENPDQARSLRLTSMVATVMGLTACEGIAAHYQCYYAVMGDILNWVMLSLHRPDLVAHVLREIMPKCKEALPMMDWSTIETDINAVLGEPDATNTPS
ncbi:hypothetical protein LCGC14_2379360 [marine sediment metagenome]|uniref:Uncharacterized protein n=1 Tax=marine sediment metagenome TaxID=412755 RepID=A0A0F9C1I1_9ZZZZ